MKRFAVAAMAAAVLTAAPAAQADPVEIGHIPECTEAVPAAISADTTPVTLTVHVWLDGVERRPRPGDLRARPGGLQPGGHHAGADVRRSGFGNTDASAIIEEAKAAGTQGAEAVYVLTSKDIHASGNTAVAGLADCIGGVAIPGRSFAVGEDVALNEVDLLGVRLLADLSAKTAAHEIGHLLGGHHHYANCAEGANAVAQSRAEPCSLMFNDLSFQALTFGVVNGAVVRGHAQRWAGTAAQRKRAARRGAVKRLRRVRSGAAR